MLTKHVRALGISAYLMRASAYCEPLYSPASNAAHEAIQGVRRSGRRSLDRHLVLLWRVDHLPPYPSYPLNKLVLRLGTVRRNELWLFAWDGMWRREAQGGAERRREAQPCPPATEHQPAESLSCRGCATLAGPVR